MRNKRINEKGAALIMALILLSLASIISLTTISQNMVNQMSINNSQSESTSRYFAEAGVEIAIKEFNLDDTYAGTPDSINDTKIDFGTTGGKLIVKKTNEVVKGKAKTITYLVKGQAKNEDEYSLEIELYSKK